MSESVHSLKNDFLEIQVNEFGAELISILNVKNQKQYLWNADPAYWKRNSPILFPIVGSLKNRTYTYQEKTYTLPQHGFARDMVFTVKEKTASQIWLSLQETEETLKVYPFRFRLEIGYELVNNKIRVMWKVTNSNTSTLYFSIGGHPGFLCPIDENFRQEDYYFLFDTKEPLHYLQVDDSCGLVVKKSFEEQAVLSTEQGLVQIDNHMFDHDALIIEHDQCHSVALLTPDKKPYVTVTFDAPLFGLWSPSMKQAPFVCIEPWYGRCDSTGFNGNLEDREWGNSLEAGTQFETSYCIEIEGDCETQNRY
ncbi:MAG: Galactose mutarotase [Herbinix sp.]|jgi:galactose mutarotase-like enzyme|nr:Galactose mutarotase [Herbinix sp.]